MTKFDVLLQIATSSDLDELYKLQKECFKIYDDKYGYFDTNPYHMDKDLLKFNINYRYGKYYKIIVDNKIIGGIFYFMLDDGLYKIAQFYLQEDYRRQGIGSYVMNEILKDQDVKVFKVDTIYEEKANVSFYLKFGFKEIEREIEKEGLTFIVFERKS